LHGTPHRQTQIASTYSAARDDAPAPRKKYMMFFEENVGKRVNEMKSKNVQK
jgi:hypothetical protein